jgi:hypothetical protein
MHDEALVPADPELPPAQAWTPKKRDISREVKVAKPAAVSHALLGHDTDSHSYADTAESGGSKKMLIIGGAIAAVAAIAAVVVFVVKPFGGSAAAATATPPCCGRSREHRHAVDRLGAAGRVFIDETPKGTTPLRLDLPSGVHRVRVEADGGLAKTLEVSVVAGKEISQLVELTKGTDRAAERAAAAAAAAASAAAAPAPPTPGFMLVDAPEDLQIVEDGRCQGVLAIEIGTGEFTLIEAKAVVIATGGAGRVFRRRVCRCCPARPCASRLRCRKGTPSTRRRGPRFPSTAASSARRRSPTSRFERIARARVQASAARRIEADSRRQGRRPVGSP